MDAVLWESRAPIWSSTPPASGRPVPDRRVHDSAAPSHGLPTSTPRAPLGDPRRRHSSCAGQRAGRRRHPVR
eukprot:3842730-Alexandrium_andersonii.AAC.1